jgi:molecular chaperone GrpE (heat shock protein)
MSQPDPDKPEEGATDAPGRDDSPPRDSGVSPPANVRASAPPTAEASPEERVAQAQADLAKLRDQLLRTAADFDNFRKRTRRELEDANKRGKESAIKELLPVFDNLERAASMPTARRTWRRWPRACASCSSSSWTASTSSG